MGALADIYDIPFYTYWEHHQACESVFHDIFVPDTCAVLPSNIESDKLTNKALFASKEGSHPPDHYTPYIFDIDTRQNFLAMSRKRAQTLKLLPYLADQLAEFQETLPAGIIGVHVRRTDLAEKINRTTDPIVVKLDKLVVEEPDATFLLCTDDLIIVDIYQSRYKDRVFWRPKAMTYWQPKDHSKRTTSIEDAVIDLYALADTSRIIGTTSSSFSWYAAFKGDIPIERL